MPAVGLLLWPVTALGGVVLTDNVITTGSFALAAFFAFLAIRRYSKSRLAAAAGGLLYGFSPYMAAQDVSHGQMVAAAVLLPVGLLLVDEALVRQRMRPVRLGLIMGAAAVAEFFILEEYFVTEMIALIVLVAIVAAVRHREIRLRWRYTASAAGVAAGVVAVILAYPIGVQLLGPDQVHGLFHNPAVFVTDLTNLVVPTSTQALAPQWATGITQHFSGNLMEWNGYVGMGLLVVVLATAIARWRDLAVRCAALFALVMTVLSLGPYLHVNGVQESIKLPFLVITKIPIVQDVIAGRLMVYTYLALGVVLAAALESLWRGRWRLAGTAAVVVFALVPLIPRSIPSQPAVAPAYFSSSAVAEIPAGTGVLTVPCPCLYNPKGISWQIAADYRFKIVGGYHIGADAPDQGCMWQLATTLGGPEVAHPVDAADRALFLQEVAENHIGAIVMAQVQDEPWAVSVLSGVLGFSPHITGGVAVWVLPAAESGAG
jgi:hypothetical protein